MTNSQPSAVDKLRAFLPQFAGYALAFSAWASGGRLAAYAIASTACYFIAVPAAIVTLITTVGKAIRAAEDGWDEIVTCKPCRRCESLARDNQQLRDALATLRLPEDR